MMLGPTQAPVSSVRSTIVDLPTKEGSMTPNIADIIRQHVTLSVSCIDRLYLHAYMPKLQTSGGLCYFLHDHLGKPIPSPRRYRRARDRAGKDARLQSPQTPHRDGGRDLRFFPAGRGRQTLLFLRPRPRLGSRLSEDRHVRPLSRQAVSERARVGQAAPAPATHRVYESRQWLPCL